MATDIQYRATAIVTHAIADTIDNTNGIPLLVLYRSLMGMITYSSFVECVQYLENAGLIKIVEGVAFRETRR